MKKILLFLLMILAVRPAVAKSYVLTSPDGRLRVEISTQNQLKYSVFRGDKVILHPSVLSMELAEGGPWGVKPTVGKVTASSVNETIESPFYKKNHVNDRYNQLRIDTKEGYSVEFRAYEDGVAYRFVSTTDRPLTVNTETVEYNFDADYPVYAAYTNSRNRKTIDEQFFNSFENTYVCEPITGLLPERLILLPALVDVGDGVKVCLTEADLDDYPGLYLIRGRQGHKLDGISPRYPHSFVTGGHDMIQEIVTGTHEYIAKVEGRRTFPWRIAVITDNDRDLVDNDMSYRLGKPNSIGDYSWVKPGKVAWEWWSDWGLRGVDFKAGINTATYKKYIDFASENGIEYIILDEGWSVLNKGDLLDVVPEIDLSAIISYGRSRNVGVILWAGYGALIKDVEGICSHYARMGVVGFKIDFMDRDDQPMVNDINRIARVCALNKLVVDFHGMYKPAGMNRTYPNVLNYEGVHGLEQMKWEKDADQVTYDVTMPFIRMLAGPVDYTQGAMRNVSREGYFPSWSEPMSQGTRCRQLAQYVVFESPLSMLCDSPSSYEREPECTRYIAGIPVVWDETVSLDGIVGRYVAVARRSGQTWYVGGMTDWNERTLTLNLDMLPDGSYEVTLYHDGANAVKYPSDFAVKKFLMSSDKQLTVDMMPGGGFAAIIKPVR